VPPASSVFCVLQQRGGVTIVSVFVVDVGAAADKKNYICSAALRAHFVERLTMAHIFISL
jgi:hypothetical protein